jgi:cytochrome c biogenesis protein CcdA
VNPGRFHIALGVVTVIVFVLTGQYMDRVHDHLVGMADAPRMLYRSTHLYILYAGLLNGIAGIGWRPYHDVVARWIQRAGSLALSLLPPLLLLGFFTEPALQDFARPYTRPATYLALASGVLLLLAHLQEAHGSKDH